MKRTPLQRRTPLRRRAARARRPTKYQLRPRDEVYMAWVRRLPCAARAMSPCLGRIDPDHAGRRPTGRKADDRTCIPMCRRHHRQRDTFKGPFRDWDKMRMRWWLAEQVRQHQRLFDHLPGELVTWPRG